MRYPRKVADFVITLPASEWASCAIGLAGAIGSRNATEGVVVVVDIPEQDLAVVSSGSQDASLKGRPFDAVERTAVAAKFQQGLSRMAHVQNANNVGVLRKRSQQVSVVRRRRQSQQRRRVRHGLLGQGRTDPTAIGICEIGLAKARGDSVIHTTYLGHPCPWARI